MVSDADTDTDGYQAYYAGKLWSLLPAIYQTLDATSTFDTNNPNPPNGPLREIVNRIGAQCATLRRSIDRMWEDQSIESCDNWVIPYIGAQLATNLVSSLDARSRRLEVFKTIYYRQRKGTLPILEEIAANTTGWDARVIEMSRRMARARHGLDPMLPWPAGAVLRTPAGGYADLRDNYVASRVGTSIDEFSYTTDVRLGQGHTGWYNIPQLGIFLWRLDSVPVQGVTPVAASDDENQYTFDPTGRDIPLFVAPEAQAFDTNWASRREAQLPGPIDLLLLRHSLSKLYASTQTPNSIGLYLATHDAMTLVPLDEISTDFRDTTRYVIDPAHGRFTTPAEPQAPTARLAVSYCYGVPSTIGAGAYDRGPVPSPGVLQTVSGGGANLPGATSGTVQIADSLTYDQAPDYAIDSTAVGLVLSAGNLQRPLIRFAPVSLELAQWTFTADMCNGVGGTLRLDGLFVSGGDIVLAGSFEKVVLSTSTLDPGAWDGTAAQLAIDGQPLLPSHLIISGTVRSLVIDRCILGPVTTTDTANVERITITNSILQVVAPNDAISITTGETRMQGCTILGNASFRQLEASDSLFYGEVTVADNQRGCMRFSAFTPGSVLPSQYECVELDPRQALFASTVFGQPDYGRLLATVGQKISAGAENGSEMGVYFRDENPIKESSLMIKYQEFMPIGLNPVLIYVT